MIALLCLISLASEVKFIALVAFAWKPLALSVTDLVLRVVQGRRLGAIATLIGYFYLALVVIIL